MLMTRPGTGNSGEIMTLDRSRKDSPERFAHGPLTGEPPGGSDTHVLRCRVLMSVSFATFWSVVTCVDDRATVGE